MKKIIFSRKGFDSHNGGFPSPVFKDGTLFSIPIPGKYNKMRYSDLNFHYENESIQKILNDLTHKKIKITGKVKECNYEHHKFRCHYDPLVSDGRMMLGQVGSALGHLLKQKVTRGDIFLFYGLFQNVYEEEGKWKYFDKPFHLVYAMMEIEEIVDVIDKEENDNFVTAHPHFDEAFKKRYKENKIFIGTRYKIFNFHSKRILTDMTNYQGVSKWKLPLSFDVSKYLSFFNNSIVEENEVILYRKGPGQEFVLNLEKMNDKEKEEIKNYLSKVLE